jgi:divalent metal cation (Fe/Co/Zn/Cd) transporter
MARIIIVEFLMFVGALLFTYAMRRLLGKRISGPPVILWCLLFAMLGAQLMSFFLRQVAFDSDFLDLSSSSVLTILSIVVVRFWENILLGAGLGMILSFFPIRKRPKTNLEDTKPKL